MLQTQSSTPKSLGLQVGVPKKGQNAEDAYTLQRREGKVNKKMADQELILFLQTVN